MLSRLTHNKILNFLKPGNWCILDLDAAVQLDPASNVAQWLEFPCSSKGIFLIEHLYKREVYKAVDKSTGTNKTKSDYFCYQVLTHEGFILVKLFFSSLEKWFRTHIITM